MADLLGGGALVDVGANIGSVCLPLAGQARSVVDVEANRSFAGLLAANALNNGLHNVSVIYGAVGETDRLAKFPMMPLSATANMGVSGFGLAGKFPEEVVAMLTLDRIAPPDATVIKVDVEGYKIQVLKGAKEALEKLRPYWLVENATGTPGDLEVLRIFSGVGYDLFWFYAPFVTARPFRGEAPKTMRGDVNVLAVPREKRPPAWEMRRVELDGPRPDHVSAFPYLKR